MTIKTNKVAIEIPGILVLFGLFTASNIYANHCRKKMYKDQVNAVTKIMEPEGTEENREETCE